MPADARRLRRAPCRWHAGLDPDRRGRPHRGWRRGRDDRGAAPVVRHAPPRHDRPAPGTHRHPRGVGRGRRLARLRELAAARDRDAVVPAAGWRARPPTRRRGRTHPTGSGTTPPTRRRRSAASACSPVARATTASSRRDPTCSCTRATRSIARSRSSGPCRADLHVSSSIDHTDFFVRVCDVYPDGRSMNVCDGLQRFTPSTIAREPDGSFRGDGGDVADGVPVRARSPCARPGVERLAPGLRTQPRDGRARPHRDGDAAGRPDRVPRLVGRPPARVEREVWRNEQVPGDESPGTHSPSPPQVHRSAPTKERCAWTGHLFSVGGRDERPGSDPRALVFPARPEAHRSAPTKERRAGPDICYRRLQPPGVVSGS